MGKKFGIGAILTAALGGAIAGAVYYLAKNNVFSEETQDSYDDMIDSAKDFGHGVQRAYTSIGNAKSFKKASRSLGDKTVDLLTAAGEVAQSGALDAYEFVKGGIQSYYNSSKKNNDDYEDDGEDEEREYIASKVKKIIKNKKPISNGKTVKTITKVKPGKITKIKTTK